MGYRTAMRKHAVFHPAGAPRMLTHGGSVALCARRACTYVRITAYVIFQGTDDVDAGKKGY